MQNDPKKKKTTPSPIKKTTLQSADNLPLFNREKKMLHVKKWCAQKQNKTYIRGQSNAGFVQFLSIFFKCTDFMHKN